MNVDFVSFIRGVRVLCKPPLIFCRINGPNVILHVMASVYLKLAPVPCAIPEWPIEQQIELNDKLVSRRLSGSRIS